MYILSIAMLITVLLFQSCSKKPSPVQPNPPNTTTEKAVWLVKPNASTYVLDYMSIDSVRWQLHEFIKVTLVIVEYQQDTLAFQPLFTASADSLVRAFRVTLIPEHRYRLRIRSSTSTVWDTSASFNVRQPMIIYFPPPNFLLTPGMRVKLKSTNPRSVPMALDYWQPNQWFYYAPASMEPEFFVERKFITNKDFHLRVRDTIYKAEYTSGSLFVKDVVNPELGIMTPFTGKRFINGDEINISYTSRHGNVAFDLTTNNGKDWQNIIPSGSGTTWRVQVNKPSSLCKIRMTANDPSFPVTMESDNFEIDTANVKFRITYPQSGDILKAGDYIFPKYESNVGDSLIFSISADDGATWKDGYQLPTEFGIENFGIFINQSPDDITRFKMRTKNGKYSAVSDRISIANDLADFFPVEVGKEWRYKYTYGYFDETTFSGWTQVSYIKTHIDSKTQDQNDIAYSCTVTNYDTNGVELSKITGIIREQTTGLHPISQANIPIGYIRSRYYSTTFDNVYLDKAVNHAERTSRGGTLQKGVGLISYSYSTMAGYWKKHYSHTWELMK